jgi:hypothetical protein
MGRISIFFACFCASGTVFVWVMVPETKNKTLEELNIYFGGESDALAAKDREMRMRVEESFGLAGVTGPEGILAQEKTVGEEERVEAAKV